ncbi:MAG: universal stress protein [Nitrospirota bacterium]|nr:universal stress protein [Nitrospirota bacterium]
MVLFNKVVLAVDGSDISRNAVKYAIELAKQSNGTVVAIHVIPPIDVMDIETFRPEKILEGLKEEGKKILSEVDELAVKAGVKVQTSIESGVPFEKICSVAETLGCDLIIMGSHGRTGIGKVLIGSVTERVISRATCPVLVVR